MSAPTPSARFIALFLFEMLEETGRPASVLAEMFMLASEYVLLALMFSVLTIVGARILWPPGVSLAGALR
jgi:hypothetical protein